MTLSRSAEEDLKTRANEKAATADIMSTLIESSFTQNVATEQKEKQQNRIKRGPPPANKPSPPLAINIAQLKKDKQTGKDINAAPKNRGMGCLDFNSCAEDTLLDSNKSFHVVNKALRKDGLYFFKNNTDDNPYMSELEAAACALYRIIAPNKVPEKATAHYNDNHTYVGVSLKAIKNFVSLKEKPLTIEDLSDPKIIEGLGIGLTLSHIWGEDDLHRDNMNKSGDRIDFDMSIWTILGMFKTGAIIDWGYRNYNEQRFRFTAHDIDNFPDVRDYKAFYWPTTQPVLSENLRRAIARIFNTESNAHQTIENEIFKLLKNSPEFHYYKFKTYLKFLLISEDRYRTEVEKHIRPDLTCTDQNGQIKSVIDLLVEHIQARKQELRSVLVKMPSFCTFLARNGEEVIDEIIAEFDEANDKAIESDIKRMNKHPESTADRLMDDWIYTEDVRQRYSNIFNETSEYMCKEYLGEESTEEEPTTPKLR